MVTYFNRKDLVSFGEYLLSEERTELLRSNCSDEELLKEKLRYVYHADIENWKEKILSVAQN